MLMHPKKRHIGLRVMDHPIVNDLLDELGQPIMSCTLIMPGNDFPETDAEDIRDKLEHQVDLVIDGGHCGIEPTTVIDVSGVMDVKERMLCRHASQRAWLREHHGMDEYVESMRRWTAMRGEQIDVTHAEAFRQHIGHGYPADDRLAELLCLPG